MTGFESYMFIFGCAQLCAILVYFSFRSRFSIVIGIFHAHFF